MDVPERSCWDPERLRKGPGLKFDARYGEVCETGICLCGKV